MTRFKSIIISSASVFLFLLTANSTVMAQSNKQFEVGLGLYTNFIGSVTSVYGEYPFLERLSAYARIGRFGYSYQNFNDYKESGNGIFIGGGVKMYPMEPGEKLSIAVGLESVSGSADWDDDGTDGDTSISGITPAVTVGYKFIFEKKFAVEPQVLYVNIPSGDIQNTTLAAIGVQLGIRF